MRSWLFVVGAFGLAIATACGDPGYEMFVENGTGQTVVVYELGAYQTGDRGFELQPGETKTSYWFRSRDEKRQAGDESQSGQQLDHSCSVARAHTSARRTTSIGPFGSR